MKFRAERDTLLTLLNTANHAASTGANRRLPILAGVHLVAENDTLHVTGTDIDTTIRTAGPIVIDTPATVVLPARLTAEIVRSLEPGVVEIADNGNDEILIAGGRTQFTVRPLSVDEWPRLPAVLPVAATLDGEQLDHALQQVLPAATKDFARPILTAVLIERNDEGFRLVATDSYRLAVRNLPGEAPLPSGSDKVLVPALALHEVRRLLDKGRRSVGVAFTADGRDVQFTSDNTVLTSRLQEGDFPNYKGLIPASYPSRFSVDRAAFSEAAKRVALMAREATPVRCTFDKNGVDLTAKAQDVGDAREHVDGTWNGPELTVGFNPHYLLAGAEACTGDVLHVDLLDGLKPAIIRGDIPAFLYLLMPVRIS
jgi:DNA polymerase-3 subunit beta